MKIHFETPPLSATAPDGLAVRYAPARRVPPRWRWRFVLLLLALVPLALAGRMLMGHFWQQAPGFVMMQGTVVRAGVAGHVTYMAPQGSALRRGDVLARVERVLVPPAGLAALSSGAAPAGRDPRVAALQEALDAAQRQRAQLQQRAALMQRLKAQGAATVHEVQAVEMEVLQAEGQAARIRAELAQLAETRQRLLAETAAANGMAGARQEEVVRMPFSGTVAQRQVVEGEWIDANADVASLISADAPVVHAYLSPRELGRAVPGQRATLVFQDGGRVAAEVLGTAAEAERQPAESASPLVARNLSVVVRLQPLQALPQRYRVQRLPLEVRFERARTWAWLNRAVARLG